MAAKPGKPVRWDVERVADGTPDTSEPRLAIALSHERAEFARLARFDGGPGATDSTIRNPRRAAYRVAAPGPSRPGA